MKLFVFAALLANCAIAAPPTVAPGERSLVVSGQGFFPVALRLQDGRIAVIMRGGAGHLGIAGRLDMVFSTDEGQTWTKPAVVVDSPVDDRNPALGQAKDGTLVAGFFRTANYDEQGKYDPKLEKPVSTWVTRSPDGGKSWTEPAAIDVSEIGWGNPYGRMVTLSDGAMLMAIYGLEVRPAGQKTASTRNHSYVYRSDDDGKSWRRIAEIGDGKLQLNETALVRLADGRILAALRSRATELWLSESQDEGRTWSAVQKLAPLNYHPADLCLVQDGRVFLTVGNRESAFGVVGLLSDPAGKFDWANRFPLVADAVSRDCGYPSSILLKDGRILTVYYATKVSAHPEWGPHCGAVFTNLP